MTLERPSASLRYLAPLMVLLTATRSSSADDERCAEPWEVVYTPSKAVPQPRATTDPSHWSLSDRLRLEVARGFCEQPAYEAESRKPAVPLIGCLPCSGAAPCNTDEATRDAPARSTVGSSPTLAPQGVAKLDLFLDRVVLGSFTQAGADEAIATLHRRAGWERFYLMRKTAGHWSTVHYTESVGAFSFAHDCKAAHMPSHRDLLVCMSGAMSGTSTSTAITVHDFASDPPVPTQLVSFDRTNQPTREVCAYQPDGPSFFLGSLSAFELADVDHDGTLDVRAALAYAEVDDQLLARFAQARGYAATCACAPFLDHDYNTRLKQGCTCSAFKFPTLAHSTLAFLARGERFEPTLATIAVLKKAHAEYVP